MWTSVNHFALIPLEGIYGNLWNVTPPLIFLTASATSGVMTNSVIAKGVLALEAASVTVIVQSE
jgi:hypothetical protein